MFLSFELIFDLAACKYRMYFGIFLSAKIAKLKVKNDHRSMSSN